MKGSSSPVDLGLENLKDKSVVEIIAAYEADKINKENIVQQSYQPCCSCLLLLKANSINKDHVVHQS